MERYFFQYDSFIYEPDYGFTGSDSVTYQVCDNLGLCDTGTVTLVVVNNPPVPPSNEFKTRVNQTLHVDGPDALGVSNSDPDHDSVSVTSYTQAANGSVTYSNSYGYLNYQPNQDFVGQDSFTYIVCDNLGACATGTASIDVEGDDKDNGSCNCNECAGEPVKVTTGNVYLNQSDYQLPGVGPAINVTRSYNSRSQIVGAFGRGWSTMYDESIQTYGSRFTRLSAPDGRATYFSRPNTSAPFAPLEHDFHGQLTQNGSGSFTLTMNDGSASQFNSSGKLLSITDRTGNQSTLAYDTNGHLTSITDPFGRVLTVTTNSNGQVLSISDPIGTVATYTYGGSSQLLSVTYADNSAFNFSYDGSFRLTTVTDALGNVVESHSYDGQGRAITSEKQSGIERYSFNYVSGTETDVTDALGRVTRYFFDNSKGRNAVTRVEGLCSCGSGSQSQSWTYDNQLNVLSHTNALGQTASYNYDANGNKLSATGVLGTSTFTYNQFSEVLTATDAMAGVTTNTYDAGGNLLSTKDALNNTTSFTYDAHGELLTMTNALGKVTTLTWDASGRLTRVKDALNNATNFAYDARARLTSGTNALNQTTSSAYDAAGRLNKITYPDTNFVSFTYDLAGRRTKIKDPRGNETNFVYDGANRLTTQTDAASHATNYGYDTMSNLTSKTDALARVTNYDYDDFNRLVKITYPPATTGATRLFETVTYDAAGNITQRADTAGRVTSYVYDAANRVTSTTDANSKTTSFQYDALSRVTAVTDALNQQYQFVFDALGRQTQMTRAGVSMSYVYDAVGNRTRRTDYNGAVTNYTFDDLNRLTTISYPDSTSAAYGYDALSRLTSATNQNGMVTFSFDNRGRITSTTDMFNQTVGYSYDANSNRTALTLGGLANAGYVYDVVNRLTKLSDNVGLAVNYAYDATNKLTSRALPNGVVTTYQYDGLDRLTRLRDATPTTTVLDNQYSYNTASQITQNVDLGGAHNYGYDSVDRLTSATYPATTAESYGYDGVGNRTASHLSASYGYQPFNKLTSTVTATYSFDNNGNLLSKTNGSGATQYAWDFENRLKQATLPNGNIVSYKYDALGRRISRTASLAQPLPLTTTTRFIYDGADVIRDTDGNGVPTADYLNGPGIDNKIRQTTAVAGALYFTQDHLGSTRALTNAAGIAVANLSYDSYGNSAGSSLTRYTYTGREFDSDTGLYYYRARFYDPQVGRFLSEDPLGLGPGPNPYEYAFDNPLKYVDPTGTQPWQQALAGGGTVVVGGAAAGGAVATGAAVVVAYGVVLYGAWQLGEAIAEAPWNPFTHPRDLPAYPRAVPKCDAKPRVDAIPLPTPSNDQDKRCSKQYEIDVSTCRGISRVRGRAAGRRCYASAMERYAACLAGRPLPPLDTWNN